VRRCCAPEISTPPTSPRPSRPSLHRRHQSQSQSRSRRMLKLSKLKLMSLPFPRIPRNLTGLSTKPSQRLMPSKQKRRLSLAQPGQSAPRRDLMMPLGMFSPIPGQVASHCLPLFRMLRRSPTPPIFRGSPMPLCRCTWRPCPSLESPSRRILPSFHLCNRIQPHPSLCRKSRLGTTSTRLCHNTTRWLMPRTRRLLRCHRMDLRPRLRLPMES
jgi:hypothetical protein